LIGHKTIKRFTSTRRSAIQCLREVFGLHVF
jgi:hypothetical protein